MTHGKTIRIYLADGTATGIRHVELVNWTGQAVVCPRARIAKLAEWPESERPGVYLLFGDDPEGHRQRVYVGEAENVSDRLKRHANNKDFWTHVIFFTSKDENLTKSHVKYLESRIVELATKAGRVILENGNVPAAPALPRGERDSMEEFLGPVALLLTALGSPILQPVPSRSTPAPAVDGSSSVADIPLVFKVGKTGVDARGFATDEGFVVQAGSVGSTTGDSLRSGWSSLRDELVAQGDITVHGDNLRFEKDVLFSSPSAAAAILAGTQRNGRRDWRTEDGRSLHVLEQEMLDAEEEAPGD